jgi:hypothetical protein
MRRKFGTCWMWYRDPIDFMDRPSNMEIGLHWYQKGTNNKWTSNLTYHLMVELETINALVFMTSILDLDAYELFLGDEKVFKNFVMNARVLYHT